MVLDTSLINTQQYKVRVEENTEHCLEVRKIYQQKLQTIVSNIGSRTSSTSVLLLLLLQLLPF